MSIVSSLKKVRLAAGFTQRQLAEMIGVKHNTISDWENGRTSPDTSQIVLLCKKLGISADILLDTDYKANNLTICAQRIGRAYDLASPPVKKTVEVALEPFMEDKEEPARVVDTEFAAELHIEPKRTMPLHFLPASAGAGVFLDSDDYETVDVGSEVPLSANFGVRISGNSMEPKYPDGYIAWIKKTPSIDIGQIGVFIVNGEGFIKKLGHGELISLNPQYSPKLLAEYDDVRTCGLVVGVSENVY